MARSVVRCVIDTLPIFVSVTAKANERVSWISLAHTLRYEAQGKTDGTLRDFPPLEGSPRDKTWIWKLEGAMVDLLPQVLMLTIEAPAELAVFNFMI